MLSRWYLIWKVKTFLIVQLTGGRIVSFRPEVQLDKEINMWNKLPIYPAWSAEKVRLNIRH